MPTLPVQWASSGAPSPLQIDEVMYDGSDAEYIVLANVSGGDLSLAGWTVGDAEEPGNGEGMYALPDLVLAPGGLFVVARQADAFRTLYGRRPDAAFEGGEDAVPQLGRRKDLAKGKLALNDAGDEIVLLAPGLQLADAVAFGKGEYGAVGSSGDLRAPGGYSLQRVPGTSYPLEADVRHRFLSAPPRPFEPRGLPLGAPAPAAVLDDGYIGVWGSLGAHSNFTAGYSAPPHYLLAAAAAQGLQFMAVADTAVTVQPVWIPNSMTVLPAWEWQGGNAGSAVVYDAYNDQVMPDLSIHGLAGYLAGSGHPVQWQGKDSPALKGLVALAADEGSGDDIAWFFKRWQAVGAPLLPAGNAEPDLPGAVAVAPCYTGLAVRGQDSANLLEALSAGRGWATSDANAWLTLQAETADGGHYWMGSWLPNAGGSSISQVLLHIAYGDLGGEAASLAIWQDGKLLQEQVPAAPGGRWSLAVNVAPGALLAAVATQADGDYAISAPLQVLRPAEGGNDVPQDGGTQPDAPESQAPGTSHSSPGQYDDKPETVAALEPTYGQAGGPPGSLAQAKLAGLEADVEFQAVVTVPPGLFNGSIYVADAAPDGVTAGIGANVYLPRGEFPPLLEGDRVRLRGRWSSYRGEMELVLAGPEDVWKLGSEPPLQPLSVWPHTVCESVEGRLVSFRGQIVGWQGDSLLVVDPAHPAAAPVRVTVRSSLSWKRPFVYKGEVWQVTGVVSQFAQRSPWNGGYRILPRYVEDLLRIE